eukprot:scaffold5448_cov244-Pinguiococcus_pyrenoidosus.AAC.1
MNSGEIQILRPIFAIEEKILLRSYVLKSDGVLVSVCSLKSGLRSRHSAPSSITLKQELRRAFRWFVSRRIFSLPKKTALALWKAHKDPA